MSLHLPDGYVRVPSGWYHHESCIFEHADGVIQDLDLMAKCEFPGIPADEILKEQIYAIDTSFGGNGAVMDSFTADWVVPQLPSYAGGQVVYFWPGFKDTQPAMGYPVLQPVLQYNQNGRHSWQFQSWFVWGNGGVSHTAPAFEVAPGEKLTSYMQFSNSSTPSFTCYSASLDSGRTSILTQGPSDRGWTSSYDWAMLVQETISVNSCSQLPAGPNAQITFTNVTVNGDANVKWTQTVTNQLRIHYTLNFVPNVCHDCNR